MWFASLQIFGSRWGPYCNKIPSSWETFWRWCPDAVYWRWLLEDQLWLDSGILLLPCNCPAWKKEGGQMGANVSTPLYPCLFTPLCPNAFLYYVSFQKAANPCLQFGQAPWLCPADCRVWSGVSRKGNASLNWDGDRTRTSPSAWHCGFNVSFTQMHISWQCWGWPGVQTWAARGRAIILKCFYWSVDFLSPSFSSFLHPASLLKTHV